jgi:hypothetical protein
LVIFFAVLALAAGAFGALGLPRLAVVAPPAQWSLAASKAELPAAPVPRPHRCRHEERVKVLPFDYAR